MKRINVSIITATLASLLASTASGQMYGTQAGGGGIASVTPDNITISGTGTIASPLSGKPATSGNPGTMSAANFVSLSALAAVYAWEAKQQQTCAIKATGLTAWKPIFVGINPPSTASGNATADGLDEGGGIAPASAVWRPVSVTVAQFMKTHQWCLAMRAKLPTPTTTAYDIGLVTGDVTKDLVVESLTASDATKYVLRWDGVGGASKSTNQTVAIDGLDHDFVIVNDGAGSPTVWLYIDGVLAASLAADSKLADGTPMMVGVYNTSSHLKRASYGYIQ